MTLSLQRVKFELISYIKEFGGKPEEWRVGCARDADADLFGMNRVDADADIWIWKRMLTPRAAALARTYMHGQLGVPLAQASKEGGIVFLFRKAARMADLSPAPSG